MDPPMQNSSSTVESNIYQLFKSNFPSNTGSNMGLPSIPGIYVSESGIPAHIILFQWDINQAPIWNENQTFEMFVSCGSFLTKRALK